MSGTGVRGALGVDREVDGTSFFGVYRCNLSIAADSSSVTIEFKVGACAGCRGRISPSVHVFRAQSGEGKVHPQYVGVVERSYECQARR